MSQFFVGSLAGILPPQVATSYVTNSGTAIPVGNVLNVVGGSGITTSGSGNTVTITVQNSFTANVQTSGAQTVNLFNIQLSLTNQTYTFDIRIAAFDITGQTALGFTLYACVKTVAGVASVVENPDKVKNKDPTDSLGDANITVSGSTMQVTVTGVSGEVINWGGFLVYVTAT